MSEFIEALDGFDDAVRRTLKTLRALAPEDFGARREGRSIAEIVEHMAISNRMLHQTISRILDAPAGQRPYAALEDGEIPHLFQRVVEPPGIATPTGEVQDRNAALSLFDQSAAPISALAGRDAPDLRLKGADHPVFGPLDGVQWALFAASHNEDHRSEIICIAAHAAALRGSATVTPA